MGVHCLSVGFEEGDGKLSLMSGSDWVTIPSRYRYRNRARFGHVGPLECLDLDAGRV